MGIANETKSAPADAVKLAFKANVEITVCAADAKNIVEAFVAAVYSFGGSVIGDPWTIASTSFFSTRNLRPKKQPVKQLFASAGFATNENRRDFLRDCIGRQQSSRLAHGKPFLKVTREDGSSYGAASLIFRDDKALVETPFIIRRLDFALLSLRRALLPRVI